MPTLYLILAHLLADFTLQTDKLIRWKQKSLMGVAVHVGIFFALTLIFLLPFLQFFVTWLLLFLLSCSHFCLDSWKIKMQKKEYNAKQLFILDQCLHIFFIFVVGFWLSLLPIHFQEIFFYQKIYLNKQLITYLSLLVFLTYTYDIFVFLIKYRFKPQKKYKPNYRAFTKRVFMFIAIYSLFILYRYLLA